MLTVLRSRIIWQDSLLSITFDRATSTTAITQWDGSHSSLNGDFPYTVCVLKLSVIALEMVSERATTAYSHHDVVHAIEDRIQQVLSIDQHGAAHLNSLTDCTSMAEYLEHWNWRMHRSYVLSEVCRPMLTKRNSPENTVRRLRNVCIDALAETVSAFVSLHNITTYALMSWAAVYRSLSSALLLGILSKLHHTEGVGATLENFVAVISSISSTNSSEVPAPIGRAVAALSQLQEDIGGGISSSESGVSEPFELSPHERMRNILWGPCHNSESSGFLSRGGL